MNILFLGNFSGFQYTNVHGHLRIPYLTQYCTTHLNVMISAKLLTETVFTSLKLIYKETKYDASRVSNQNRMSLLHCPTTQRSHLVHFNNPMPSTTPDIS